MSGFRGGSKTIPGGNQREFFVCCSSIPLCVLILNRFIQIDIHIGYFHRPSQQ